MATDAPPAHTDPAVAVAVDMAGLPRPTTGRIFVLVIALLGIGLTAGDQIHNSVAGDGWLATVRACVARYPNGLSLGNSDSTALTRCLAGSQRLHALFLAVGAALVILGAFAFILAAPWIIRYRRGLRPAGPRAQPALDRITELARRLGLRRTPGLETAGPRQRDAYCFGRPGAPVIVLPLKIIARPFPGSAFEPVVLHELAHVKHRDVTFSWLARGFVTVAALVALVPAVIALATADLTALPDYLWRVVALVGVGWFVARAVLRTREYDADLAASCAGGTGALRAVLTGPAARPTSTGWRHYLDHHPAPVERLRALDDPGRIATAGVSSGLLPATLVFTIVPSLQTISSVALTGVDTTVWLLPGIVIGSVLLAASVGIDVVRAARVEASTQRRRLRDARVCVGAGSGAVLGQIISPESAWQGIFAGVPVPTMFFSGLLVCGATAVACGVARAVTDRKPGGLGTIALTVIPWGFALWLGLSIELMGQLGLDVVRLQLLFNGASWPGAACAVAMIVMLAWALRRRAAAAALVGVSAGVCGAAVMIASHLLRLGPDDDLARASFFVMGVDQAAIAAIVSAAALAALLGVRGAAEGGVAAAAAAITGSVAFVVFLVARGSTIDATVLTGVAMPMLTFPAAGWLAVAPGGLVVARRQRIPPIWTQMVIAAAVTTSVVAVGSGIGPLLAPSPLALLPQTAEDDPLAAGTLTVDAVDYRYLLAPDWNDQFVALVGLVDTDAEGAPDPAVAAGLANLVEPSVATLDAQIDQVRGADPAVQSVHEDLIAAVDNLSQYVDRTVDYHRGNDPSAIRQALDSRRQSMDDYQRWMRGLQTL